MTAPILTGYYRYTDIWFEWCQVLPEKDGQMLKAILAHDAITHPDHPLHVDGVDGVKLYIGTLHTGEERLLFSSKQVDYIRYWLHAMKLTESEIPLPYSDCLLEHGDGEGKDIRFVTEVVYKNGGDLRGAIKVIDKKNKKLKGSSPRLVACRAIFDRVQELFKEKKHVFLAIDLESWERDHQMITELGYSAIHWEGEKEIVEDGHLIVKEHENYRNGTYVADNRYRYNFGTSEVLPKAQFKQRIHKLFEHYQSLGALFLVFHDASGDIKYLKSGMIEAPLDGISYVLPDINTSPDKGLYVVDTSDLFAALEGEGTKNRKGLANVCRLLGIDTRFLHNAGNDAHYTLMACVEMAGGDALIAQRERRWPEAVVPGSAKLNFDPHQENSDFSDEEGLLG